MKERLASWLVNEQQFNWTWSANISKYCGCYRQNVTWRKHKRFFGNKSHLRIYRSRFIVNGISIIWSYKAPGSCEVIIIFRTIRRDNDLKLELIVVFQLLSTINRICVCALCLLRETIISRLDDILLPSALMKTYALKRPCCFINTLKAETRSHLKQK